VEAPHEWLVGFPAFVPVTVQMDMQKGIEIPKWSATDIHPPISLSVTDANGRTRETKPSHSAFVKDELETDLGPQAIMKDRWIFRDQELRRVVVNIGGLLDGLGLTNGEYQVTLCLWSDPRQPVASSAPFRILVQRPDSHDDQLWKKAFMQTGASRHVPANLSILPAELLPTLSEPVRRDVSFFCLLKETTSAMSDRPVDFACYKALVPPHLQPETDVLEYQYRLSQGMAGVAAQIKGKIQRSSPGLAWWLEEIDARVRRE